MIGRLSRVALKHYPKMCGRIRIISENMRDDVRNKNTTVAHIFWDDGNNSWCPTDKLVELEFYKELKYPWESENENKDNSEAKN